MGSGLVGYSIGAVGSKEVGINDAKQATRLAQFTKKKQQQIPLALFERMFPVKWEDFFFKKSLIVIV